MSAPPTDSLRDDFSPPAAHSMNTDWFGVDDAGEVAAFHPGYSAGVMPIEASEFRADESVLGEWMPTGLARLLESLPPEAPRATMTQLIGGAESGLRNPPPTKRFGPHVGRLLADPPTKRGKPAPGDWQYFEKVALQLRSSESVETARKFLSRRVSIVMRCADGILMLALLIEQSRLAELVAAGDCLDWWPFMPRAVHLGLHSYSSDDDEALDTIEPYSLIGSPAVPLPIAYLKALLPPKFLIPQFKGVRFGETPKIQVCDYYRCKDFTGEIQA